MAGSIHLIFANHDDPLNNHKGVVNKMQEAASSCHTIATQMGISQHIIKAIPKNCRYFVF